MYSAAWHRAVAEVLCCARAELTQLMNDRCTAHAVAFRNVACLSDRVTLVSGLKKNQVEKEMFADPPLVHSKTFS